MKSKLKESTKYIGFLLTLVSFYYIILSLIQNYNKIEQLLTGEILFFAILLGLLLYTVSQFNLVLAWQILLKKQYPKIKFKIFYYIVGISQIGKYLPGNIGHVIGRVYLAQKFKIKILDSSKSLVYESILVVFAGMIVSLGYFNYYKNNILGINITAFKVLFLATLISILIYLFYPTNKKQRFLNIKSVLTILLLYIFSFAMLGLILYFIQFLLNTTEYISLTKYIVVITISFIAGYIVPGSPAGIGIREFVFVTILSNEIDTSVSLALIFILRIITILGDILMYLISLKTKAAYS